ncbi:MAG: hypothetical protein U1E51_25080, partial [Candidatus Binatia bacterium]|nr:hypothetical protein [Candidatus Binatia bacterium]
MREAEQLAGPRRNFVRMDLLNYHLALPAPRCVMGHYRFSRETLERYRDEWNFITLLRNPVDRWYSHYFYNKNNDSIYKINEELDEYVETDTALFLGSLYVSVVTGETQRKPIRTQEYIKEAVDILRNFAVVGSLE